MENQELDMVYSLAPSETENKIVHRVGARYVGTLATPGVIAPTVQREDCGNFG
jgi:hypothetical protein